MMIVVFVVPLGKSKPIAMDRRQQHIQRFLELISTFHHHQRQQQQHHCKITACKFQHRYH